MEVSGYCHAAVAFRVGAGAPSAHSMGGRVGLCRGLSCAQANDSLPDTVPLHASHVALPA